MSNDVFFLGAGFSKSIINDYPDLKGLSEEISEKFQFEKESVGMHFRNEVPEIYHKNIETLLTYLSTNLPYKTDVQMSTDGALYKDIINKIADYFIDKTKQENLRNAKGDVRVWNLMNFIVKKKATCITLNYDLLLEELLIGGVSEKYQDARPAPVINDFYKCPIIPLASRTGERGKWGGTRGGYHPLSAPLIIKLHGSINWMYAGITPTDPIYLRDISYPLPEYEYLSADLKTLIVPPVLDKNSQYFHTILKTLWKNAFKAIENAKNIYIYGFSFPQTDLAVSFLFQSALRSNPHDYKIYVINTANASGIKKRYDSIFGKGRCDYSFCCNNQLERFSEYLKTRSQY